MESRISKWGNSLGIRIPLLFAEHIGICEREIVDLFVDGDRIIIAKAKNYKLEELVAKITAKNKHDEVDTGHSTGQEIW